MAANSDATILQINRADGSSAAHVKVFGDRLFNKYGNGTADTELGTIVAERWYELRITLNFLGTTSAHVRIDSAAPIPLRMYSFAPVTQLEISSSAAAISRVWWDRMDVTTRALTPAPRQTR